MPDPQRRPTRDRDAEGRPENARPRDRTGRPLPYDTTGAELAERPEPLPPDASLSVAVARWDEQRYFEAHEYLETVWHAAPEADASFWQGVIQVAVGCVHHQRGNHVGATTLFDKAAGRLAAYPDVHHGVDVEQLRVFAVGAAAAIRQAGFTVEIGYPEFPAMDDGPWYEAPGGAA